MDFFEKAYLLNPSNTVLNYIGCCYIGLEIFDKAIELFQTLICTTHWETPWYNLGRVYLKIENFNDALKCFNEAIEIRPDDDTCNFYLGVYYERMGDFEIALKYYESAVDLSLDMYDKAMYYTNAGICYSNLQNNQKAVSCFKNALRICPKYDKSKLELERLGESV